MNNTVLLAKEIEEIVCRELARIRATADDQPYSASALTLYQHVVGSHIVRGVVTSGFFNKVIADMKRTGIIGTTKGGEKVFLSEAAWDSCKEEYKAFINGANRVRAIIERLVGEGVFQDRQDAFNKMKAAGVAKDGKDGRVTMNSSEVFEWLEKFGGAQ